jgi:uroporphyrinogen-III synthase
MPSKQTVMVTRPEGQAAELLAAMQQRGLQGIHQPMLALRPLAALPPAQREYLLELDRYQHIIFISANAVRYGLACIDDFWPQLPAGIHWYAIGVSTARLLAQRGLQPISPAEKMDSESLLALPGLTQVAGQRVLIVKGEGGRQTLYDVLTARGAQVDELACYQRKCPEMAAGELAAILHDQQVKIVLISSGEGLSNMLTLLSDTENTKFRDIALIVPSSRVAAQAQQAGFTDITTAANASDQAMLEALLNRRGEAERVSDK